MRILVTGHHGYLGSITSSVLAAAGNDVVGLDTFFYSGCDFAASESPVPSITADVRDLGEDELRGYDAIVHLAALSNDPLGDLDPSLTDEINFRASLSLARSAKQASVKRFVFASSCSMYGLCSGAEDVDESAPLTPLTPYAASKVRAEQSLLLLADDNFTPIFMRNATAFGVSPRLRADVVLNNLAGWAHTTNEIRILSDGTPWRPLVHVEDIARATLALLGAPRELVHGEAFNIGGANQNYQVRELAEIVHAARPECRVEIAGSGDPDPRSYRVSFAKFAEAFPDFVFGWTAPKGAVELLDAYERAGLTLEDFTGHKYTRLAALRRLLNDGSVDDRLRWTTSRAEAAEAAGAL